MKHLSTATRARGVYLRAALVLSVGTSSCQPTTDAASPRAPAHSAASADAPDAAQEPVKEYGTLPPEQREAPPPPAPSPSWSFPQIVDTRLSNGLELKSVERNTLPLVQITLLVRSGQATDGPKPGQAVLAGEMLKVGGSGTYSSQTLLDKVESLGSSLDVLTSRDSTAISLSVTSDRFDEALDLLGLVVQKPQFNQTEFNKLKRREMDRVSSAAKTSAAWAANMVLYRELYRTPAGNHPYAAYDATSAQIEKLGLWEIKNWYQQHVSPKNASLVVAGDIGAEQLEASAKRVFGSWRGAVVQPLEVPTPKLQDGMKVFLVDRPKSSQAEVNLALFGPAYSSDEYPTLKVANQILGGGVAGRLFGDVREKRSLAYSTYSTVERMARGPLPVVLRAGTQTAKAGLTLQALLEHATSMVDNAPGPDETTIASRYLSDLFLLRMESVGSLGSMVSNLAEYRLPNDYYDQYRQAVMNTNAAVVASVSKQYFGGCCMIAVVAGDAERLQGPLSRFADVVVIDPNEGFQQVRSVPRDPSAKLELERIEGT